MVEDHDLDGSRWKSVLNTDSFQFYFTGTTNTETILTQWSSKIRPMFLKIFLKVYTSGRTETRLVRVVLLILLWQHCCQTLLLSSFLGFLRRLWCNISDAALVMLLLGLENYGSGGYPVRSLIKKRGLINNGYFLTNNASSVKFGTFWFISIMKSLQVECPYISPCIKML